AFNLLQLAVQSLLREEALAISALQHLPMGLFPPLFNAAFIGRHAKILKAMRQKLQVLDLRNVHHGFWDGCAEGEDGECISRGCV
ncbi:hypothetical protein A6R68_15602, partial [Neotoma lepida]